MPAAVSENTPQEAFGRNLANRRCSERQRSQQVASPAAGKGKRKAERLRPEAERKARNGKAEERSRNRQVESKGRKTRADRLTGPDAGEVVGR